MMMQDEKDTLTNILSRICFIFTPTNLKFSFVNKNIILKEMKDNVQIFIAFVLFLIFNKIFCKTNEIIMITLP